MEPADARDAENDRAKSGDFAYTHGFRVALRLPLVEQHEYDAAAVRHKELLSVVFPIVRRAISDAGIPIAAINARVKAYESISAKMYRKRYTAFSQIGDLAGIRTICYFRDHVRAVYDAVSGQLECADLQDDVEDVDEHDFGYHALHFSVGLPRSHPQRKKYSGTRCEVQVRTPAMDAWAALSHFIGYKKELDIPQPLRRRLNALSALFFVADSEFLRVRDELEQFSRELADQLSQGRNLPLTAEVLSEAVRLVFPDREVEDREQFVEIMRDLSATELKTSEELLRILQAGEAAYALYEKTYPPSFGDAYAGQGVLRYLLWISGHLEVASWAHDHDLAPLRAAYGGPRGPHWSD